MASKAVWVPRHQRKTPKDKKPPLTAEQIVALNAARQARGAERTRRAMEARRRAWMLLTDAHPEEFAALLADMTAQINAERGDLPVVDRDLL